ncbi:MAG: phosphatase PAP2 family protein [Patescibacteria group bacterium]
MSAIEQFDNAVQDAIFSLREENLNSIMIFITYFGDKEIIFPLSFFIILYFFLKKKYEFLIALLTSISIISVIVYSIKLFFYKPRPSLADALILESGFSFPSGHVAVAIVFYGILSYFVFISAKRNFEKISSILLFVIMVFLITFSRVYLGVHFLSDVMASMIFSTVWLGFLIYLLEIKRKQEVVRDRSIISV